MKTIPLSVLLGVAVVLTGCGASEGDSGPSTQPTAAVSDAPQSDAPLEIPGLPSPAATLSAPEAPAADGVATENPQVYPQFVPPDISLSGIAVAVSSTTAEAGQTIEVAAQAAPELAGHTAYLVSSFSPSATTLATGQVGTDGRFTIGFEVDSDTTAVVVIAQANVASDAPYNFDDIVARSAELDVTTGS